MVEDELQPIRDGTVKQDGNLPTILQRMAADIERHGEVHANFEHVDGEIECRLGTAKLFPSRIEVFDGDQWHVFRSEKLVDWEVPMDMRH